MRVNVYAEELTGEVQLDAAHPGPGRSYIGLRFILASSDQLHHEPGGDDRSAVTLWFRSRPEALEVLEGARAELEAF